MNQPPRVFKSAVGAFYYGILLFIAVVTVAAFKPALEQNPLALILPSLFFTLLFSWGLPLWLLFTTDYTVTTDELKVRSGPFKWTIRREDIRDITPTRHHLSSPALSLNRLEIRYGAGKRILVSPRDRNGFYRALGFTPQG